MLDSLAFVRGVYPANADVHAYSGGAWLQLGRSASARRELTIGLTQQTRAPGVYVSRALAAARLGDGTRARADLETATRYDPALGARVRAQVEQEIAAGPRGRPAGGAAGRARVERPRRRAAGGAGRPGH